jgi:5-methylcytosine-specific restriction endonuclease McrA
MGTCSNKSILKAHDTLNHSNVEQKVVKDLVIIRVKKPYKKKSIPPKLREDVWRAYCGNSMDGKCYCCATHITYREHESGHVLAESKGGLTQLNNLKPTCRSCNRSMGTTHMEEYKIAHYS